MSYRKKLGRIITDFLEVDTKLKMFRSKPTDKQRKYKNVEIAEDFKKIDDMRRKERFENIRKRKQLLQKKIKNESNIKLLTSSEQQLITEELNSLQQLIDDTKKQLVEVTGKIDDLEADYMLLEGSMKISVLNHIRYMQYMDDHNPGYVLHPETIQIIENIHYCVNHNLPVNRIKLYEIMPEFYESEIGELEESVRRLIKQKKLFDQPENSHINFFYRIQNENSEELSIEDLVEEKDYNRLRLHEHLYNILEKHGDLLSKICSGQTPFRGIDHFHTVLLSDMPIKLLPQEEEYKQTLFQMLEAIEDFNEYENQVKQEIQEIKTAYVQPPVFVARHPVLMKRWEQIMVCHTNPVQYQDEFPVDPDLTEVRLAQKMEEEIRKVVKQKYDPWFIEMMNTDRSKIDNKKLELQFLNFSTNIMEQIKALPDFSSPEQEVFEKLPKNSKQLLSNRKKPLLKLDELTRILYLNKKDKSKYNLQFFSKWFGIDRQQLKSVLNTFSYLRAIDTLSKTKSLNLDEKQDKQFKYEIIKFEM